MTVVISPVAAVARVAHRYDLTTNRSLRVTGRGVGRGIYAGQIKMTSHAYVTHSQTRTVVQCGQATGHTPPTSATPGHTAANGNPTAANGSPMDVARGAGTP